MFEELFKEFPGLQNAYEMAVQELGFKGTPEDFIRQNNQDFAQNIPGFSAVTGTPVQPTMPVQPNMNVQPMAQSLMTPSTPIVDPTMAAYQRSLLSGTTQPVNPYGFGFATSPYYGYPRNPYAGILY
jgi:hypothetical protein